MSPWATRLKVGTTALVLEAIARNPARYFPRLTDPICALVSISRDPRCRCEVGLENKRRCGAIAIQREYARAVAELCDLSAPEKRLLLADWTTVLDDLEKDPMLCGNRLDWVAKLAMIGEFQKMCNISDGDPWLRSLDLEYHRLDAESGLYYALEQQGGICGAPTEDAVFDAMISPPATTRAYIRGRCVQKFPDMIISAQWDHITLQGSGGPLRISMMDMFTPQRLAAAARIVDSAESPDDLEEIAD